MNFFLIFFQILLITIVIYNEFQKKVNKNFIVIFVSVAYLVLVQFQAMWIWERFQNENVEILTIVGNTFTYKSFSITNLVFTISTIIYYFTIKYNNKLFTTLQYPKNFVQINFIGYIFIINWFIFFTFLLIKKIGGVEDAINKPGQMIEGQTVFLLLLGIAKWPLLYKASYRQKLNIVDIILFICFLFVTLFNSRFLAAFSFLQLFFVYNYRIKEISNKFIFSIAIPLFLIFIVFGLYRDFAYRFDTQGIIESIQQYKSVKDDFSISDWFFMFNVEAFSGTAGIINESINNSSFSYDYGLSELSVFFNFIPNSIRTDPNNILNLLNEKIKNSYSYKNGSVVPSGFETSFGHFSYFGIFLYTYLIAYLSVFFHNRIVRKTGPNFSIFISVHMLNGIRASLFGALIFFGMAELVTRFIFKKFIKTRKLN